MLRKRVFTWRNLIWFGFFANALTALYAEGIAQFLNFAFAAMNLFNLRERGGE